MQTGADSLASPALVESLFALFDRLEGVQCWVKDRNGRYRWVNRAFLLNYSLEHLDQVVGKTDFDLSPPHLADQYRVDDERALRGEAIAARIELVGRFDHTAAWSVTHKLPVRDANGRITGSAGLTRPVGSAAVSDVQDAALGRVIAMIRADFAKAWSNTALARAAHLSVRAFERRFHAVFRVTPQHYIRTLRVRLACHALVHGGEPLTAIAKQHGFATQSHFTREFRRVTKMTPGKYRDQFRAH